MLEQMLREVRSRVANAGADGLLVTQPANVRYLSGFSSPEDGRVLITDDSCTLITDGRYVAQAEQESRVDVEIVKDQKAVLSFVKDSLGDRRLAVEADHMTLAFYQELTSALGQEPVHSTGIVQELRLIKSPAEIASLKKAAKITDEAFSHILTKIRAGIQEIEVALELEAHMLRSGAEAKSFDIIVASGTRSAMPHGVASHKVIERGELVTLDFGAVVDGYHADMTRTVAVGEIAAELKEMYEAVLEAQLAALEAVAPGVDGRDVDRAARDALAERGLGEYFAHGLGHGVGLEVHEMPRLTYLRSYLLRTGMTATIEPGVYIPGQAGVRIEDLLVITDDGFERLSQSDKHLITV